MSRADHTIRATLLAALLASATLAASLGACGATTPRGARAGHVLRPGSDGSTIVGPTSPGRRLEVSLVLRLPGRAALDRFLSASDDPHSSGYRQTTTPAQFGARFGLSSRRLTGLRRSLSAHGLTVTQTYPQRTAMRVSGSAQLLEAAFSTRLEDRIDRRGLRYVAPTSTPRLPPWLASDVTAVTGLNTQPLLRPADIPSGGLTGVELGQAYDFSSLRSQGIDGSEQTVAVISFDTYEPGDLSNFESHFGIGGPSVQQVDVSGGATAGSQKAEVDLDLETLRAIAPGAQVLDYDAPQSASTGDVVNRIVADHRANVITTSWGQCQLRLPHSVQEDDQSALAAARAAGITIFAASGDNGAYDCQSQSLLDQRPSVDWPAASANVVGVGGTRLAVRPDGSYLAEYGWEDILQGAGSGGGLSSSDPLPSWQHGTGVRNSDSNGSRQVPDVAGPADPASGMVVYAQGGQHQVGGTSAAAPFWAGVSLLLRQYAQQHGAGDLGFLAPLLYQVATNPANSGAFHEPVRGGNRLYSVTPGWNYVTGLGSPDVAVLAKALVALKAH